MRLPIIFAAAVLAAASGAHAGTAADAKRHTGVNYQCGGVGSDEAQTMKREARQHSLMLTFATRAGNYLSDVAVDIADAHGRTLLTTTCDGPIMLVDLPQGGTYRIHGALAGHSASAVTSIRPEAKGSTLHLVLPGTREGQG